MKRRETTRSEAEVLEDLPQARWERDAAVGGGRSATAGTGRDPFPLRPDRSEVATLEGEPQEKLEPLGDLINGLGRRAHTSSRDLACRKERRAGREVEAPPYLRE